MRGGTGSVWGGTGWYMMVLGQKKAALVSICVSMGRYCHQKRFEVWFHSYWTHCICIQIPDFMFVFYMKVSVSLQSVCGYARWRNFRGSASVEHGRDLNHPQSTQSEGTLWPMSTTFQVGIAQFAKIYWHSLLVNRVAISAVGGARDFSNWGKIRAIKLFCGQHRSRQGLGGRISRRWACPW